ncbi:XkdF-like putative serine protease domain-containing protein [Myroides sp. C4067]|uniref:XkdF-like putative serine protease domain-containing protein n=1 Tax=Myroides sp. C4067 TaxID=3136765 RepID=UPI0031015D4C
MKENIVLGVALIPDKLIYRQPNFKIMKEHYISFSAETIRSLRNKFHNDNREKNITINHNGQNLSGVELIDSFLINESNKNTLPYEFKDLPIGTWMIKYKIVNELIWQMIQEKKLNGFSIEGFFDLVEVK